MTEVQPGQAVTVCQAFTLQDESDVTLQAGEAFSFGGGTVDLSGTENQIIFSRYSQPKMLRIFFCFFGILSA